MNPYYFYRLSASLPFNHITICPSHSAAGGFHVFMLGYLSSRFLPSRTTSEAQRRTHTMSSISECVQKIPFCTNIQWLMRIVLVSLLWAGNLLQKAPTKSKRLQDVCGSSSTKAILSIHKRLNMCGSIHIIHSKPAQTHPPPPYGLQAHTCIDTGFPSQHSNTPNSRTRKITPKALRPAP